MLSVELGPKVIDKWEQFPANIASIRKQVHNVMGLPPEPQSTTPEVHCTHAKSCFRLTQKRDLMLQAFLCQHSRNNQFEIFV